MRLGIRLAIVWAALSLVGVGCASMEWTQELFAKRQIQVDERFVKVETDVREHGDRIDRVEVRVTQLDNRLTETRDSIHSTDAPVTTAAVDRASPPEARSPRPKADRVPPPARTLVAVIHVPFGFDRAHLDAVAEAALAEILKDLRENPRLTIDLEGSTDATGRLDYNIRLSQRRVEAVKRWLLGHGVERTRIVGTTARGPLADASVKDDVKRRVMVKLMSSSE